MAQQGFGETALAKDQSISVIFLLRLSSTKVEPLILVAEPTDDKPKYLIIENQQLMSPISTYSCSKYFLKLVFTENPREYDMKL